MYFVLCIYAVSFDVASAMAASRGPYWAGMPPVWVVLTAFPALPCPEISEAAGQAPDNIVGGYHSGGSQVQNVQARVQGVAARLFQKLKRRQH